MSEQTYLQVRVKKCAGQMCRPNIYVHYQQQNLLMDVIHILKTGGALASTVNGLYEILTDDADKSYVTTQLRGMVSHNVYIVYNCYINKSSK